MKIVEVEWEDAVSNSGYYNEDHPERHNPILCKLVGHLITKNKKVVILAAEVFEDGDRRHIHTIPRKMVKNITVLSK